MGRDPGPAVVAPAKADLFAVPFDSTEAKRQTILQACVNHPWWFVCESSPEERALAASMIIHDPLNKVWEVWRGGTFVGILVLWQIQPAVNAVFHFVFFDQNLVGKRKLILNFLAHCFAPVDEGGLGLRRVTMEVPEFKPALLGFARRKLGFRFEGEDRSRKLVEGRGFKVKDPYRPNHRCDELDLLISAGSRREHAHWFEGHWHDVLVLRLMAAELDPER